MGATPTGHTMYAEAQEWVKRLDLIPHPEGGWYREVYRSPDRVHLTTSDRHGGERSAMTSIYFLLEGTAVSRLHRLKSTEVWYHHAGGVVRLVCFEPGGEVREIRLGCARDADVRPQVVIPAGGWFGAVLESVHDWALMGCAVAPGFEFQDFELARRSELLKQYPRHRTWIERLTLPDATNP